jgi:hypothetical protein
MMMTEEDEKGKEIEKVYSSVPPISFLLMLLCSKKLRPPGFLQKKKNSHARNKQHSISAHSFTPTKK